MIRIMTYYLEFIENLMEKCVLKRFWAVEGLEFHRETKLVALFKSEYIQVYDFDKPKFENTLPQTTRVVEKNDANNTVQKKVFV